MVNDEVKLVKIHKQFFINYVETADEVSVQTVSQSDNKIVAQVNFFKNGDHLIAGYVNVEPEYRGQGLASTMYSFVHEIGKKIKPSKLQSDQGKLMWKKFRENKLPFTKETFFERITRHSGEILSNMGL